MRQQPSIWILGSSNVALIVLVIGSSVKVCLLLQRLLNIPKYFWIHSLLFRLLKSPATIFSYLNVDFIESLKLLSCSQMIHRLASKSNGTVFLNIFFFTCEILSVRRIVITQSFLSLQLIFEYPPNLINDCVLYVLIPSINLILNC
jgi:hypothetical protein